MYTTEDIVKEIRSNCLVQTAEISKQLTDIKTQLGGLKKDIERVNDFKIEHKKSHQEQTKTMTSYKIAIIAAFLSAIASFLFNLFTTK